MDRLEAGKKLYVDQEIVFTDPIPTRFNNKTYIRTVNADRQQSGATNLFFTVAQPVKVYVALDERIQTPPTWMAGWKLRSETLTTSDAHPGRKVYEKDFAKGLVTLGGNYETGMDAAVNMYSVIILPANNDVQDWAIYK